MFRRAHTRFGRRFGAPLLHEPRPRRLLALIGLVWLLGTIGVLAVALPISAPAPRGTLTLTHWANGHMMEQALLPAFAAEFNAAGYQTSSGQRIEVRPYLANSGVITTELISRVGRGVALNGSLPDPTIVTPAADHWLSHVNYALGQTVVDLSTTKVMAITYLGIATLREMAECLGWPNKEIGFADVVALRADPRGWATCPKAKTEWGQRPLLSFTDPDSSSTARSMLYTLYSIAAGKPPEQLTPADTGGPEVVEYLKAFQRAVDHYVPDTLVLNSKIYLGPRYGHFFFIAEDNLVKLYQGKLPVTVVADTRPKPLERDMVMIYPKEGSPTHAHSAAVVQANWVTPEHAEAAQQWIAFLHQEPRQRAFMQEGFRPATSIPFANTISRRFGLDPTRPTRTLNPDRMDPAAAQAIISSWEEVKNSGVAVFVVDRSGSMAGAKLEQAKRGLIGAIDHISSRTQVGLLTFSDQVLDRVPVAPITQNKFDISRAVEQMRATGATKLYDAIKEAIQMADDAPADRDAIRGVVVVTDGKATGGQPLHSIVHMMSTGETPIATCQGFETDTDCLDANGARVARKDVIGTGLAARTRNPVHIFYVGLGADADLDVGRILAEATGSAYRTTSEQNLAAVLEQFGKYF